jgi:hypothetical protein
VSSYDALKGVLLSPTASWSKQATSKKQSSIKDLSKLVHACVNHGGYTKTRDDLTHKIKRDMVDHFVVGKANVVEEQRSEADVENLLQP